MYEGIMFMYSSELDEHDNKQVAIQIAVNKYFFFIAYCLKSLLFDDGINVAEVASLLVVVEAIANDEVVGNLEGSILDVEWHLQLLGLHEQGADVDRSRIARAEGFNHALHGATCVDDVLDNDDMTV